MQDPKQEQTEELEPQELEQATGGYRLRTVHRPAPETPERRFTLGPPQVTT